jgi:hypothetical protein
VGRCKGKGKCAERGKRRGTSKKSWPIPVRNALISPSGLHPQVLIPLRGLLPPSAVTLATNPSWEAQEGPFSLCVGTPFESHPSWGGMVWSPWALLLCQLSHTFYYYYYYYYYWWCWGLNLGFTRQVLHHLSHTPSPFLLLLLFR